MDMSMVFKNDIKELYGKDFYYSRRFAKGNFNVIKPHTHRHYEIYYLTEGSRRYFQKNRFFVLRKGDFVIISPDTLHYTASSSSDNHERILLNFTEEYVPTEIKAFTDALCGKVCVSIPEEKREMIEEIFSRIAAEYGRADKYSDFVKKALLSELLINVLRIEAGTENVIESSEESGIDGLLEYINVNLSNDITLEDAAVYAGFSKSHFSKKFKEMTGFTFGNYLHLQRLLKACRLLEKTQESVSAIADECGFMSSGYFSTVFKNHFSMSPLEYRKSKNASDKTAVALT